MTMQTRHGAIRSVAGALMGALAGCAIIAAATACGSASPISAGRPQSASALVGRSAPASWHRATLPGGGAVLAYPPSMHLVKGDTGTLTAARFSASGKYLLYINVTPKQGDESLGDWVNFRLDHQREEETPAIHELSDQAGVRFLGGQGSCVTDAYVTKVGANHFTEIACFVQGRTSANVIVVAAPTANWGSAAGVLSRAIAGFVVR
jgi:hypothetical protein